MKLPKKKYQFWATVFKQNGSPVLQLRKQFFAEEDIEELISEIMEKGEVVFLGKVSFNNTLNAKARLKEMGLIQTQE